MPTPNDSQLPSYLALPVNVSCLFGLARLLAPMGFYEDSVLVDLLGDWFLIILI
jgi:hypothetical protein